MTMQNKIMTAQQIYIEICCLYDALRNAAVKGDYDELNRLKTQYEEFKGKEWHVAEPVKVSEHAVVSQTACDGPNHYNEMDDHERFLMLQSVLSLPHLNYESSVRANHILMELVERIGQVPQYQAKPLIEFTGIITNGELDEDTINGYVSEGWFFIVTIPAIYVHPKAQNTDKCSIFTRYNGDWCADHKMKFDRQK